MFTSKKEIRSTNLLKKIVIIVIFLLFSFLAYSSLTSNLSINKDAEIVTEKNISIEKEYCNYKEVAAYIHEFKNLPPNYMTKEEAQQKGWDGGNPQYDIGGNVCIGGDRFANLEKLLPDDKEYYECDVDYSDENRGPSRLIYTKDGKVYYTNDHYETFVELY